MAGRGCKKEIDIDKLKALCENGESISVICQELKISKNTLYRNAKTNGEIETLLKERTELQENNIVDLAKSAIVEILTDKKHPSRATIAIFVLKTRDKWVEDRTPETTVKDDNSVNITITRDDKKRD